MDEKARMGAPSVATAGWVKEQREEMVRKWEASSK
jgi:hypothetical protein